MSVAGVLIGCAAKTAPERHQAVLGVSVKARVAFAPAQILIAACTMSNASRDLETRAVPRAAPVWRSRQRSAPAGRRQARHRSRRSDARRKSRCLQIPRRTGNSALPETRRRGWRQPASGRSSRRRRGWKHCSNAIPRGQSARRGPRSLIPCNTHELTSLARGDWQSAGNGASERGCPGTGRKPSPRINRRPSGVAGNAKRSGRPIGKLLDAGR